MGLGPERKAVVPEKNLRQESYDLLYRVRKPSIEEQIEFASRGFIFLRIEPKTLPEVIQEDPSYFRRDQLNYVNAIPSLRDFALPNSMLVAIDPTRVFVMGSFDEDRPLQLVMTQNHSRGLIEAINPYARSVMLPASGLSQLDKACKAKTGNELLMRQFGRVLDNTSDDYPVSIGRDRPGNPLRVVWRHSADGIPRAGAVSAVVFIQK